MKALKRPSGSMVVAMVALFIALGGAASANVGLFSGHQIKPGTVGHKQLAPRSVQYNNLGRGVVHGDNLSGGLVKLLTALANASGSTGAQGPAGRRGPRGPKGDQGDLGPTGEPGSTPAEPTATCTPNLCVDLTPGSGDGWGSATDVNVGTEAPLTVKVIQWQPSSTGSLTLTWNPNDFRLAAGGASSTCNHTLPFWLNCTLVNFGFGNYSFTFVPLQDNTDAVVSATVQTGGDEARAQFPIAITG